MSIRARIDCAFRVLRMPALSKITSLYVSSDALFIGVHLVRTFVASHSAPGPCGALSALLAWRRVASYGHW